jgi:hypothetical protein
VRFDQLPAPAGQIVKKVKSIDVLVDEIDAEMCIAKDVSEIEGPSSA